MRALYYMTVLFLFNPNGNCHDLSAEVIHGKGFKSIKLCEVCTCSEIPNYHGTEIELYIQCTEFDKIQNIADLDEIDWPLNPNWLKISATFDGLGLTTLGKMPRNANVETLKFTNNVINSYCPDPLSELPNLKSLSFSNNELTAITPDLFTKMEKLEDLDLSYNKLSEVTRAHFKDLTHIKRLSLRSNNLQTIPLDALQRMTSLEDLDLSRNGITNLVLQRNGQQNLARLKRLSLNENNIRSINKDTFPANNLIELLDLSNNVIELIDDNAFLSCKNLRELNLAQNDITFAFAIPPSLQIAIFKFNTLYHWPRFPDGMKYIDLSYNKLSDMFDEGSSNFENLEVLVVCGNQIKDLIIQKPLPSLFILDLSYNLLTEIPNTISTLYFPNLEELHFDGNPIVNIYFKNNIFLKRLYMNEIKTIEVVESKTFSNVIGRGTNDSYKPDCFSLYMSNCPSLEQIQLGAFDGTGLCMLDISKNNLTTISKSLLDWTTVVDGVDLQYNPWNCNCDMQWVLDELLPQIYATNNSKLLAELRCAAPRGFEDIRMVHWYGWKEQALCSEALFRGNYLQELSGGSVPKVTYLTVILSACILIGLIISLALSMYLVNTRQKYIIRQKRRKRQNLNKKKKKRNSDNQEQFCSLNKV